MNTHRMLLFCIAAILFGFAPPPPKGALAGVVEMDGTPFDNVLIFLDENNYRKLDWNSGRFLMEKVPSGVYTLKVLIADSSRGHYAFEFPRFTVLPNTITTIPSLPFTNAKCRRTESPIPTVYRHRYWIELIRFNLDDPNIRNVQIEKPFIIFGGYDWQKDIDDVARDLVKHYGNNPVYNNYITVEGHASTNEMGGSAARIRELARERAKSVVNYISQNYHVDRDRFLIFSRGADDMKNAGDPMNGENRRVVVSYDLLY
ncbi:MAG: OmpA family protein [Spirochaetota bacterium]|mgnify:CR=1 FL=1